MTRICSLILCLLSIAGCTRNFEWSEEPKLGDGTLINVDRSIELDYKNEWMQMFFREPLEYSLRARNPKSGEKFAWRGEYGLVPIGLEFVGDDVFLVVISSMCDADLSMYGNPKLPYIVLRRGIFKWTQVPWQDRPASLGRANLSFEWSRENTRLPVETIERWNEESERVTASYFQRELPSSFETWGYKHKDTWGEPCGSRDADLRNAPEWK
jgi:hypothetical protein